VQSSDVYTAEVKEQIIEMTLNSSGAVL